MGQTDDDVIGKDWDVIPVDDIRTSFVKIQIESFYMDAQGGFVEIEAWGNHGKSTKNNLVEK